MLQCIIFCDICNPQAIRYIEQKRDALRGDIGGRRVTDGCSWFEGTKDEALEWGWLYEDGEHLCPRCRDRHNKV